MAADAAGGLGQRFFKTKPRAGDRHANFEAAFIIAKPLRVQGNRARNDATWTPSPSPPRASRCGPGGPTTASRSSPSTASRRCFATSTPLTREESDAMIDRIERAVCRVPAGASGRWRSGRAALLIGHLRPHAPSPAPAVRARRSRSAGACRDAGRARGWPVKPPRRPCGSASRTSGFDRIVAYTTAGEHAVLGPHGAARHEPGSAPSSIPTCPKATGCGLTSSLREAPLASAVLTAHVDQLAPERRRGFALGDDHRLAVTPAPFGKAPRGSVGSDRGERP